MFRSVIEEDKYGNSQVKFYLTQGDSCGILSKPKDESGEAVDPLLIRRVTFKFMDSSYNVLFQKNLSLQENGVYLLRLLPEETSNFSVGDSKYEIEYELNDGGINTTNSWKFIIVQQGVEQ